MVVITTMEMGMCYSRLLQCCYGMYVQYHAGATGHSRSSEGCHQTTEPFGHLAHFQLLGRIALFQSAPACTPPDSECSHLSPSQRSPGNLFYPKQGFARNLGPAKAPILGTHRRTPARTSGLCRTLTAAAVAEAAWKPVDV